MEIVPDMLRKARNALLRRGVAAQDAEDLVHEAFLKVEQYERSHAVQSQEAMMVTAAVNLTVDRARRRRRAPFAETTIDLQSIIDRTPGPEEIVRSQARLRRAAEGLDRLPERTRRILLARRLDGLAYAEIARGEDMSVAAVEKQVARATLQLMEWMAEW
jgi:RNA polymerase sigma factor (sigma-70 family)